MDTLKTIELLTEASDKKGIVAYHLRKELEEKLSDQIEEQDCEIILEIHYTNIQNTNRVLVEVFALKKLLINTTVSNKCRADICSFLLNLPFDLKNANSKNLFLCLEMIQLAIAGKYKEFSKQAEQSLRSNYKQNLSTIIVTLIDYFTEVIGMDSIPLLGEALDNNLWGSEDFSFDCCNALGKLGHKDGLPYLERAISRYENSLSSVGKDIYKHAFIAIGKINNTQPLSVENLLAPSYQDNYYVLIEEGDDLRSIPKESSLLNEILEEKFEPVDLLARSIHMQMDMIDIFRQFRDNLSHVNQQNYDAILFSLFWSSSDENGKCWIDENFDADVVDSCFSPDRCGQFVDIINSLIRIEVEENYPMDHKGISHQVFHQVIDSWKNGLK